MDIDDMELASQRGHWKINERHLGSDGGLDNNAMYCKIGNEMLYDALEALTDIVIEYSHRITEASSKSDYEEDYLCPHIAQVWLAGHLSRATKILVDYFGGYAIGVGDTQRAVSQALGSGHDSSGNLKIVHPDMQKMKELVQKQVKSKNPFECIYESMEFDDGFGGTVQVTIQNPQIEEIPQQIEEVHENLRKIPIK